LTPHPMLPVFVGAFTNGSVVGVDATASAALELIMETPSISPALLRALLRKKRVIVVVDGVSEMTGTAISNAIRPDHVRRTPERLS
jgi:hypothetical protein